MPSAKTAYSNILMIVSLIFVVHSTGFGQDRGQAVLEEAEYAHHLWRTRVSDLTRLVTIDARSMTDGEQAMYSAYLAKFWWKIDNSEAREHLSRSEQRLVAVVDSSRAKDIGPQLPAFQKALSIITSLDEDLAIRLMAKMESGASDGDRKPDPQMAELFVAMALEIVDENPRLALAAGMDSLRHGLATGLPWLIGKIHQNEPQLAEQLMNESLRLARSRHRPDGHLFLFNMGRVAVGLDGNTGLPLPIQRIALRAFADALNSALAIEQERNVRCGIAYYASWFTPSIDTQMPEIAVTYRQSLAACIPYTNQSQRENVRTRNIPTPNSVDEILTLARETKDLEAKVNLYRDALGRLQREEKFARMVSVLDGLDGDDFRDASPRGWDNWRTDAAVRGAFEAFEDGDIPTAFRFIDRTPKRLRPAVRDELVRKEAVRANREFFLENLREMEKELAGIDLPDYEVARLYLALAEQYFSITPTDAVSSFRTAIKFINSSDRSNPGGVPEDWAPMEDTVWLSSDLLAYDEIGVNTALNELSSERSRIRLRLGLLESSLPKYAAARDKLNSLRTVRSVPVRSEP
jgi:hypothetical protein